MITVHHLSFSRSTRVLWLMEELGLAYNLVRHERDERFKAPPSLAAVHPLGKAPVIEDGALVLAESSVILAYINQKYGQGRLAPPSDTGAYLMHEEWLQYAESTAAFPIMSMRIGALTGGLSPRMQAFLEPTLQRTVDHIAHAVRVHAYLMGNSVMLADIQMAYLIEVAHKTAPLGKHPELVDYLDRLKIRPAFVKAQLVGGPMMPPT